MLGMKFSKIGELIKLREVPVVQTFLLSTVCTPEPILVAVLLEAEEKDTAARGLGTAKPKGTLAKR